MWRVGPYRWGLCPHHMGVTITGSVRFGMCMLYLAGLIHSCAIFDILIVPLSKFLISCFHFFHSVDVLAFMCVVLTVGWPAQWICEGIAGCSCGCSRTGSALAEAPKKLSVAGASKAASATSVAQEPPSSPEACVVTIQT